MTAQLSGAWNLEQVHAFLASSHYPMRLSCVGQDGFPRVVSLWYRFDDPLILCVAHCNSHLLRLLQQSDKVGFEIAPNEPPYCGVRGQGIASIGDDDDNAVLSSLLQRYLGDRESSLGQWLLSRGEEERLISIQPTRLFSWDYSDRMADSA